jgi:hypothetical protein
VASAAGSAWPQSAPQTPRLFHRAGWLAAGLTPRCTPDHQQRAGSHRNLWLSHSICDPRAVGVRVNSNVRPQGEKRPTPRALNAARISTSPTAP